MRFQLNIFKRNTFGGYYIEHYCICFTIVVAIQYSRIVIDQSHLSDFV